MDEKKTVTFQTQEQVDFQKSVVEDLKYLNNKITINSISIISIMLLGLSVIISSLARIFFK